MYDSSSLMPGQSRWHGQVAQEAAWMVGVENCGEFRVGNGTDGWDGSGGRWSQ